MLKKVSVWITLLAFFVASCQTTSSGVNLASQQVGPGAPTQSELKVIPAQEDRPRIEVAIPVFDPGIPEDENQWEEQGIWPELRQAEANIFAVKLKEALEDTGVFGAVRVTPDATATADYYVLGGINQSTGLEVSLDIVTKDITGRTRINDSFEHEVSPRFHKSTRNKNKNAYDPLFKEIAKAIVEDLRKSDKKELAYIKEVSAIRFANAFQPDHFEPFLSEKNGRFTLASLPAQNDPMVQRTNALRIKDQMFVDRLQQDYDQFASDIDRSYKIWQEEAYHHEKARADARRETIGNAFLGALVIAAGVASAIGAKNSGNATRQTLGAAGAVAGAIGGIALLNSAFKSNEETKVHSETIEELGESIDLEMSPKVIAIEESTQELSGTAKEQYAQWRQLLKEIHEAEKTPDIQL